MESLFDKLYKIAESDVYPYHMPGHKRQGWGKLPESMYGADITEIDGFDNLHQPEGVLRNLQNEAARLYGAEESFYLINGSTCGVLAAVSGALPAGGHILMARNCHKSAYHAAYLRNLAVSYLYPPYLEEYDIFDAVPPGRIRAALEREPGIGAVMVVSPTYEGRVADIAAIAEIVHEKGIPLIVDEAHGAHLGLAEGHPENSCRLGADLVIHSLHKTLPSLTQTALLHVNGRLVDRGRLKRFLHIYQSSSPSYILMASIDNAIKYLESDGRGAFGRFRILFENMMRTLAGCRRLRFLPDHRDAGKTGTDSGSRAVQDMGKLLISVKGTGLTGKRLYDILLERYHLQMEMASESYVLAMFTVNDKEEAYRRMTDALMEIDQSLAAGVGTGGRDDESQTFRPEDLRTQAIPLWPAWDMDSELVALDEAVGRPVGEFVSLYPPGVPLLVPGERMTEAIYLCLKRYIRQGLTVQGLEMRDGVPAVKTLRMQSLERRDSVSW